MKKTCKKCGVISKEENFIYYGQKLNSCLDCEKERRRIARHKRYWANPQPSIDKANEWNKSNRQRFLQKDKERRNKRRKEVLEHYGGIPPKCSCCGESEDKFLTIDHIERHGGKKEREKLKGGGHHNYRYIRKMNYPKGIYRVLCYNCNCGRERNNGICPHEQKK